MREARRAFVIGLTGGIGSGKSTVAALLGRAGFRVFDADASVRRLLREPSVRARIRRAFGPDIMRPDSGVDRRALGDAVFRDPRRLAVLDGILHPLVRRDRERRLSRARPGEAWVLDVPLLVEAGWHRECDLLVHVQAPLRVRARRFAARTGLPAAELGRREANQLPPARKRRLADVVIRNSGGVAALARRVAALARRIRRMIRTRSRTP